MDEAKQIKNNTKKYLAHHILRVTQEFLQALHNYSYSTKEQQELLNAAVPP